MWWIDITNFIFIAFVLFCLKAWCEAILRREFGNEFLRSVLEANRLEFPFARNAQRIETMQLEEFGVQGWRLSKQERRLLTRYFRVIFLMLAAKRRMARALGAPLGIIWARGERRNCAKKRRFIVLLLGRSRSRHAP